MKKISYSAPAKVILSGEHAVVYGKPALASAINLRLKFTLIDSIKSNQIDNIDKNVLFIAQKVKEHLKNQQIKFSNDGFNYKIDSEIPVGRGLGSSAAFCVSATACFLKFYTKRDFPKETVNNLAYQIEKHFHKNPSGIDNTTSCFGGLIFYRKEFEFLKNISTFYFKIPKEIEKNLFLIDSGKPKETTAQMVNLVGNLYNKKPVFVEKILNNIEKTTKRIVVSLINEDKRLFIKCLVDNQIFLEMLGIVSSKTKKLLKDLEKYGFGKITGAGGKEEGSGFIIFYAVDKKKLIDYLKEKKLFFLKFASNYQGVTEL